MKNITRKIDEILELIKSEIDNRRILRDNAEDEGNTLIAESYSDDIELLKDAQDMFDNAADMLENIN